MQTTAERQRAAQILGVAVTADELTVKAAYRRAAMQAHPDTGGAGNSVVFQQLTWAANQMLERRPAAGWVQAPGQAPTAASSAQSPESVFRLGIQVHRGPVVWIRSRFRPRTVVLVTGFSGAMLTAASAGWSELSVPAALPMAVGLVGAAVFGAVGRPERGAVIAAVRRWREGRDDGSDWPTGPIEPMTDDRIRRFEQTGR